MKQHMHTQLLTFTVFGAIIVFMEVSQKGTTHTHTHTLLIHSYSSLFVDEGENPVLQSDV